MEIGQRVLIDNPEETCTQKYYRRIAVITEILKGGWYKLLVDGYKYSVCFTGNEFSEIELNLPNEFEVCFIVLKNGEFSFSKGIAMQDELNKDYYNISNCLLSGIHRLDINKINFDKQAFQDHFEIWLSSCCLIQDVDTIKQSMKNYTKEILQDAKNRLDCLERDIINEFRE